MISLLVLAAAFGMPPCWDVFDAALRHSAASSHPAFVSYDERIRITQDDLRLVQSTAHIDYRDDGVARVQDERFAFRPILTLHEEPGPPVLGPYGQNRDSWLPQTEVFPTIARVRAQGDMVCRLRDIETYKGHRAYHLTFTGGATNRPSIKALWVDTSSSTIWKLIVSGYVRFADDPSDDTRSLANFEVELGYAGPYLVVNHVVWSYGRHEYSQVSNYFGEYTLSGYSFPQSLPSAYFGGTTAVR
jgi:hypothetical protein